jgi:hypothetical protein
MSDELNTALVFMCTAFGWCAIGFVILKAWKFFKDE